MHLGSATHGHRSSRQRRNGGFGRGYMLRRYGLLHGRVMSVSDDGIGGAPLFGFLGICRGMDLRGARGGGRLFPAAEWNIDWPAGHVVGAKIVRQKLCGILRSQLRRRHRCREVRERFMADAERGEDTESATQRQDRGQYCRDHQA